MRTGRIDAFARSVVITHGERHGMQGIGGEVRPAAGAVAEHGAVVHQAVFEEYDLAARDGSRRDHRLAGFGNEVRDRRGVLVGACANEDHAAQTNRQHHQQRQPPVAAVHHKTAPDVAEYAIDHCFTFVIPSP
ncbi:MAG: hypothetical protein IPG33_18135 [Betaproteobacteria bacterium]|nr:hypothetical protein [Betaproteobacteria bacterium]